MTMIDSCGKNAKEKQLIRFLDKYIKEKKWESVHSKQFTKLWKEYKRQNEQARKVLELC